MNKDACGHGRIICVTLHRGAARRYAEISRANEQPIVPSAGASTRKIRSTVSARLSNEEPVIAALSVISVTVGTVFAWMAGRHARYQQAMEAFGGILLIAGFALLGYSLEAIFCPPL